MTDEANSFRLERPLVGFRSWYTRPLVPRTLFRFPVAGVAPKLKPLVLYPMTTEIPWSTGINKATCSKEDRQTTLKIEHTSPHADCSCGLHAYVNLEHNESQWISHLFDKDLIVTGAVLMWGEIMVGSTVIRAQYAEIVGLIADSNIAKLIAEKYDVPCVTKDHLLYLATEYGDRVSPEIERKIERVIQERTESIKKMEVPKYLRETS